MDNPTPFLLHTPFSFTRQKMQKIQPKLESGILPWCLSCILYVVAIMTSHRCIGKEDTAHYLIVSDSRTTSSFCCSPVRGGFPLHNSCFILYAYFVIHSYFVMCSFCTIYLFHVTLSFIYSRPARASAVKLFGQLLMHLAHDNNTWYHCITVLLLLILI